MILVVLAIAIIFLIVGAILLYKGFKKNDDLLMAPLFLVIFAAIAIFFLSIFVFAFIDDCASAPAIERKIIAYELENAEIEERINIAVKEYLKHEKDVMADISGDITDPMAVVMAYPELNSSAIVTEQINVWKSNNNEIKDLKAKRIDIATSRWWLYFGGDKMLEEIDAELEAQSVKN